MGLGGMLVLWTGGPLLGYRSSTEREEPTKLTAAVAGKPEIRDVPGGNEGSTAAGDMQVPQHTEGEAGSNPGTARTRTAGAR